jgi:Protein of unknown function (DUF3047)
MLRKARFELVKLKLLLYAAILCPSAAVFAQNNTINWIGDFNDGLSGWSVVRIDKRVPATTFRAANIGGVAAVEAKAIKSMALLTKQTTVNLSQTPILCWRWRVSSVVKSADISRKSGDDQAARIYVGLDLPAKSMSIGARAKVALARQKGGSAVPDGALNYVWDNKLAVGTSRANVYTDRARIIVQQSGNRQAGQWVTERRDLAADIAGQFRTNAGRVISIAVSSDTDNTGETTTAAFADIHLVNRNTSCQFK